MREELKILFSALRNSYSALVFSRDSWVGPALFLVTMLYPTSGLCGLFCCLLVNALALYLSLDRFKLVFGLYGFNAVIVGVAIGTIFPFGLSLAAMLVALSLLILLLITGLDGILSKYRLPYLVSPFLLCLWVVLLLTQQMNGEFLLDCVYDYRYTLGGHGGLSVSLLSENPLWEALPEWLTSYFQGLSCILFRQDLFAGFILALILLCYSRIAFFFTFVTHLCAFGLYQLFGGALFQIPYICFGFNFILTSLALGCCYLVPSLGSLLFSLLLIPVQFIVVYSSSRLLSYLYLPTFSLSFCVVSLLALMMMRLRTSHKHVRFSTFLERTPEENLYYNLTNERRFRSYNYRSFSLPFYGEWKVQQGVDGAFTHRGAWKDAWDFVVEADGLQYQGDGSKVEDYYCYGKPVLAPADATVVCVMNEVDDNPVGERNETQNWGNYVVLDHGDGLYSLLAHLKRDSFFCSVGQTVRRGDELALCGNSGLSPYPHLHFQFQSSPYAGTPTLSYPLVNYFEVKGGEASLKLCDFPCENDVLTNKGNLCGLGSFYAFYVGQKLHVRSEVLGDSEWTVKEDFGYKYICDEKHSAKAWFAYQNGLFEFQRYEGGKNCALYYFFLSHLRMIMDDVDGWRLADEMPLSICRMGWLGHFHDFLAPFRSLGETEYVAERAVGGSAVVSSVSTRLFGKNHESLSFETIKSGHNLLRVNVNDRQKLSVEIYL